MSTNAKAQIYNIGLIAGISFLYLFSFGCFALCILLGLMILKPFRLNEMVLFLLRLPDAVLFSWQLSVSFQSVHLANFMPHVSVSADT